MISGWTYNNTKTSVVPISKTSENQVEPSVKTGQNTGTLPVEEDPSMVPSWVSIPQLVPNAAPPVLQRVLQNTIGIISLLQEMRRPHVVRVLVWLPPHLVRPLRRNLLDPPRLSLFPVVPPLFSNIDAPRVLLLLSHELPLYRDKT